MSAQSETFSLVISHMHKDRTKKVVPTSNHTSHPDDHLSLTHIESTAGSRLALHDGLNHRVPAHWIRHVAYSLHDAVLAAVLLGGLPAAPQNVDTAFFGAPPRGSGKVCVLGISGSSRGGKGVLSQGLQNKFGFKNTWVIPCDSYFNTMAIGSLEPSWWGGETAPAGDFAKSKRGNWDSPGAVDHCKLLADAKHLIAEAERLSAADGEHRLVVFEGFMLFYDPLLVQLFDTQIWLELTYEVAHARRMATTPMPQSHYDNGLWPNYCAYKDIGVFGTQKVATIDGTLQVDEVLMEGIAMLADGGADGTSLFAPAAAGAGAAPNAARL